MTPTPTDSPRRTVLFDMDGTLFPLDSQLRFCRWVLRRHGWRRLYLLFLLPMGLLKALGLIRTATMKRAFLSYAWGMKKDTLQAECRAFAEEEILPALYPEVRERLEAHLRAGDRCVLCSASPDWWTQEVGRLLGFTHTIGTPLLMGERVPLMPRIPAPGNNKGANKLLRLEERCGITHAAMGYTDSAADIPLLSLCEQAVLVNPKPGFAALYPQATILTPAQGSHGLLTVVRALLGC